jgi:hypothetical protein
MSTAFGPTDAFDRAIDPVLQILRPEQALEIANYHGDASLQARIEALALKANEGELSDDELAEYEGYAQANRFLAVLQAKARQRIDADGAR